MATYLILNILVFAIIVFCLWSWRALVLDRLILVVLAVLLVTTAIFDTVMIQLNLFAYNSEFLLGLYVGQAPVEDFFYAIVAGIFVPAVWKKLGRHDGQTSTTL